MTGLLNRAAACSEAKAVFPVKKSLVTTLYSTNTRKVVFRIVFRPTDLGEVVFHQLLSKMRAMVSEHCASKFSSIPGKSDEKFLLFSCSNPTLIFDIDECSLLMHNVHYHGMKLANHQEKLLNIFDISSDFAFINEAHT